MYTLDGKATSQTYVVTADSPQQTEGDATNFVFYSVNNLAAGAHTLSINITDVVNQTYRLDYLVYSPSFSSLASMPDLPAATNVASLYPNLPATITEVASTTLIPQTVNNPRKSAVPSVVVLIGSALAGALATLLLLALVLQFRRIRERGWRAPPVPNTDQSAFTDGQA